MQTVPHMHPHISGGIIEKSCSVCARGGGDPVVKDQHNWFANIMLGIDKGWSGEQQLVDYVFIVSDKENF